MGERKAFTVTFCSNFCEGFSECGFWNPTQFGIWINIIYIFWIGQFLLKNKQTKNIRNMIEKILDEILVENNYICRKITENPLINALLRKLFDKKCSIVSIKIFSTVFICLFVFDEQLSAHKSLPIPIWDFPNIVSAVKKTRGARIFYFILRERSSNTASK